MKFTGKVIISEYQGKTHRLLILTDNPQHWFVDNIVHNTKLGRNEKALPAKITIDIPDVATEKVTKEA